MGKLRIVGGEFRGRLLKAPDGRGTRPTTDRVREALFNILEHRDPPVLEGATVLDLFAGSGALGFEALSRGAARAIFVDNDRSAQAVIAETAQTLELVNEIEIIRGNAVRLGKAKVSASLVFTDAPYDQGLLTPALENAAAKGWIADGATSVLELDSDEVIELPSGFSQTDERVYGGTKLVFAQYCS